MALTKQDLKSIKDITIEVSSRQTEKLAEVVGKSFQYVQEDLSKIHSKLEEHDKKFEKIDQQLNYQNQKMDQYHCGLSNKIDSVAKMLTGDLEPVYADINNLKLRVTKLETAKV